MTLQSLIYGFLISFLVMIIVLGSLIVSSKRYRHWLRTFTAKQRYLFSHVVAMTTTILGLVLALHFNS